ncbi:MAG: zinc ABC transporter substrate-binding protein [Deltaproteobacteria bacterium]|nr:zinc ABC transporter substrate-binding protein [Deltaproteobacteria bacterium]
MRRLLLGLLPAFLLAVPHPARAGLRIAATVPDLAALAREVAGARAEVFSLTLPTQDPHYADARPHLALQLNRANLLLTVGLGLEVGWLPTLLSGARNPAIQPGTAGHLDCSTLAQLKDVPQAKVDRSQGDVHPGGNPHYLTDPDNAVRIARVLGERLGQLDPAGAATYRRNALAFVAALGGARRRWLAFAASVRGRPVVTYHKSWVYLTDFLGLRVVAQLEPKPGIPPSPSHVLQVMLLMRSERVSVLLQEDYYPDRTAQLMAEKTGARVVRLPGGTNLAGGERYLQRMEALVQRVVRAFSVGSAGR